MTDGVQGQRDAVFVTRVTDLQYVSGMCNSERGCVCAMRVSENVCLMQVCVRSFIAQPRLSQDHCTVLKMFLQIKRVCFI